MNEIKTLILKYNEGVADPAEVRRIEQLIEEGAVQLTDLRGLSLLDEQLMKIEPPVPSLELDNQFYKMLATEKKKAKPFHFSFEFPSWSTLLPRLAFTIAVLATGFGIGHYFNGSVASDAEVRILAQQMGDLKEMMALSLLEKESASERLKAVSLTTEMDQASKKVTSALVQTLNDDSNVNVRLAALDALVPYARDPRVRLELVRSISKQDSPLVQVALAELMRDLHEKRSVTEFDKLLKGDKIPDEVKRRIKEKIQVLI